MEITVPNPGMSTTSKQEKRLTIPEKKYEHGLVSDVHAVAFRECT